MFKVSMCLLAMFFVCACVCVRSCVFKREWQRSWPMKLIPHFGSVGDNSYQSNNFHVVSLIDIQSWRNIVKFYTQNFSHTMHLCPNKQLLNGIMTNLSALTLWKDHPCCGVYFLRTRLTLNQKYPMYAAFKVSALDNSIPWLSDREWNWINLD